MPAWSECERHMRQRSCSWARCGNGTNYDSSFVTALSESPRSEQCTEKCCVVPDDERWRKSQVVYLSSAKRDNAGASFEHRAQPQANDHSEGLPALADLFLGFRRQVGVTSPKTSTLRQRHLRLGGFSVLGRRRRNAKTQNIRPGGREHVRVREPYSRRFLGATVGFGGKRLLCWALFCSSIVSWLAKPSAWDATLDGGRGEAHVASSQVLVNIGNLIEMDVIAHADSPRSRTEESSRGSEGQECVRGAVHTERGRTDVEPTARVLFVDQTRSRRGHVGWTRRELGELASGMTKLCRLQVTVSSTFADGQLRQVSAQTATWRTLSRWSQVAQFDVDTSVFFQPIPTLRVHVSISLHQGISGSIVVTNTGICHISMFHTGIC